MKRTLIVVGLVAVWAAAAAAEGRWQAIEDRSDCEVWNGQPQPDESVSWSGDCVAGKAEGSGLLVWTYKNEGDKRLTTYRGEMKGGRLDGRGTVAWGSGGSYEGDFADGEMQGQGIRVWRDGTRYEGQYVAGLPEGEGVMIWANGNRYAGSFVKGKKQGQGTYTLAANSETLFDEKSVKSFTGTFAEDRPSDGTCTRVDLATFHCYFDPDSGWKEF